MGADHVDLLVLALAQMGVDHDGAVVAAVDPLARVAVPQHRPHHAVQLPGRGGAAGVEEVPGDVDLEGRVGALGQRLLVAAQVHQAVMVLDHRPGRRSQHRDLGAGHGAESSESARRPVAGANRFARVRRHEKPSIPTRPVRSDPRVRGIAGGRATQGGGKEAGGDPGDLARRDPARARSRKGPRHGGQLSGLRGQRLLRRHDLPPRDPGLHDPGRRLRRRHDAEAHQASDQERSRQRPRERHLDDRDGAHVGEGQRHGAVLHQSEGQRLPEPRRP